MRYLFGKGKVGDKEGMKPDIRVETAPRVLVRRIFRFSAQDRPLPSVTLADLTLEYCSARRNNGRCCRMETPPSTCVQRVRVPGSEGCERYGGGMMAGTIAMSFRIYNVCTHTVAATLSFLSRAIFSSVGQTRVTGGDNEEGFWVLGGPGDEEGSPGWRLTGTLSA